MLFDVSIGDFPSWFDVQDILQAWVWASDTIVDMKYGIGFGDKDWTFNFHESGDSIWYIDFYYQTTEVKYSLPVWRLDMTLNVLRTYHEMTFAARRIGNVLSLCCFDDYLGDFRNGMDSICDNQLESYLLFLFCYQ